MYNFVYNDLFNINIKSNNAAFTFDHLSKLCLILKCTKSRSMNMGTMQMYGRIRVDFVNDTS